MSVTYGLETAAPTDRPKVQRDRLSRAANEKPPSLAAPDAGLPITTKTNILIAADTLAPFAPARPHWDLRPFGSVIVAVFSDQIDFIV